MMWRVVGSKSSENGGTKTQKVGKEAKGEARGVKRSVGSMVGLFDVECAYSFCVEM